MNSEWTSSRDARTAEQSCSLLNFKRNRIQQQCKSCKYRTRSDNWFVCNKIILRVFIILILYHPEIILVSREVKTVAGESDYNGLISTHPEQVNWKSFQCNIFSTSWWRMVGEAWYHWCGDSERRSQNSINKIITEHSRVTLTHRSVIDSWDQLRSNVWPRSRTWDNTGATLTWDIMSWENRGLWELFEKDTEITKHTVPRTNIFC